MHFYFALIIILYLFSTNLDNKLLSQENQIRIIDGDTIQINKKKYRLHGIDAPEIDQYCTIDKKKYKCGLESKLFLESLIINKQVNCKKKNIDRYNRIIAVCFINDLNINSQMVRYGWAIAYKYFSKEFIKDELFARNKKLGIWKGTFINPRDWRRKKR